MEPDQIESSLKPILTLECDPQRIHVRAYRASDAQAAAKAVNNKKIWANLSDGVPHPYTLEDADWWINKCLDRTQWRESASLGHHMPTNYAITQCTADGTDDVIIGSIGLVFQSDVQRRSAEFGYWLAEEHWGKGIMTRVVKEFVPWVWETFGPEQLVKLAAKVFEWNEASVKVLKKGGFEYEGTQKMAVVKDGRLGDLVMLGFVRPGL